MTRIKQFLASALAVVVGALALGVFGFIGLVVVGITATFAAIAGLGMTIQRASRTTSVGGVVDAEIVN